RVIDEPCRTVVEVCHAIENPIGTSCLEQRSPLARRVVASTNEPPDRHATRLSSLHTANAVLDHKGPLHRRSHLSSRINEEVRCRLAVTHHTCGEDAAADHLRESGQPQRVVDPLDVARRGYAEGNAQRPQHGGCTRDWLQRAGECCFYCDTQLVEEI